MKKGRRNRLRIAVLSLGGFFLSCSLFAGSPAPSQHVQTPSASPVRGGSNRPLPMVPARPLAPGVSSVSSGGNCAIGSYTLDFGLLAANPGRDVIATGSLTIHCPQGLAVAINVGDGASATPVHRRMTFAGPGGQTHFLEYQLYTDAAGSSIWGTGFAGGRTMNLVGTGTPQTIRIYGRIPAAGTSPPAVGNYSDIITITLSF